MSTLFIFLVNKILKMQNWDVTVNLSTYMYVDMVN